MAGHDQPAIPGLEVLVSTNPNADRKQATSQEQMKALYARVLSLELEVSLLRLLLENPKGSDNEG